MAESTYTVKVSLLGNMRNRDVVEAAALEGRIIPPVVEYVSAGTEVKLNPTSAHTKALLASGAIEVPGESAKREQEALQARMDALKAEQDALAAQRKTLAKA